MEDDIKLLGSTLKLISIFLDHVVAMQDLAQNWPDHALALAVSICAQSRNWTPEYACEVGDAYIEFVKEGTAG